MLTALCLRIVQRPLGPWRHPSTNTGAGRYAGDDACDGLHDLVGEMLISATMSEAASLRTTSAALESASRPTPIALAPVSPITSFSACESGRAAPMAAHKLAMG